MEYEQRRKAGCIFFIVMALIAFICNVIKDDSDDNKKNEVTQQSSSYTPVVPPQPSSRVVEKTDPTIDAYKNNQLQNGSQPYANEMSLSGNGSEIIVKTSSVSSSDLVVLLKKNGYLVRNQYVRPGSYAHFYVPNGTYQIFFYNGKGWNPNKTMPNGKKGGFVLYESFSKDNPQTLEGHVLTYELIPQQNGNFQQRPSNANEVFN